ncbi:MAG: hypothetical protein B7Z66_07515 [Chromatiales bacterium 21-64-14]|nr:MAG: hypothetical protein B7Z66_07515 [Chromatiales bacterium 21-64-14]HQU15420.1 YqaA family protein [Gammaproteobacteria bacterium]
MAVFRAIYDRAIGWAAHRHAPWYLAAVSFSEASFFLLPPDALLAPMCMARPRRWRQLALITTVTSVLGALFGYLIGHLAFDGVAPWLHRFGYWESFLRVQSWFREWGFWAVLLAGFSPVPYKLFTIAAGVVTMSLLPFVAASFLSRGGRFFLVAGLMAWGGPRMQARLRNSIEGIGWLLIGAGLIAYLMLRG